MLGVYSAATLGVRIFDNISLRLDADDEEGVLRSRVLPGLWLQPERFWEGDLAGVLAILQQGLASPEHEAFVRRLQGAVSDQ